MFKPRDYQEDILNKLDAAMESGKNDTLVVAGTGAGKSSTMLEFVSRQIERDPSSRHLIMCHRIKLVDQPMERVGEFWSHLTDKCGIVRARKNDIHKQVIFASRDTLRNPSRLNHLLSAGHIDTITIDECHYYSDAYAQIVDTLRKYNPDLFHVGYTATPERADNTLADHYTHTAAVYGTPELIESDWLVLPDVIGVQTDIETVNIMSQGAGEKRDYNQAQLTAAVEASNLNQLIVRTHTENCPDKQAIAFCQSVRMAYELQGEFEKVGIPAIAMDSKVSVKERNRLEEQFKSGKYQILCNYGLFVEGWDFPELEVCHMGRPTKRDSIWCQCVGRVLRIADGKTKATVYDYQPRERNVNISLSKRVEKLTGLPQARGGGGQKEEKGGIGYGENIYLTVLDYFNSGNGSKKNWIEDGSGWRVIGFGRGDDGIDRSIAVSPDGLEPELWVVWKNADSWDYKSALYREGDFGDVMAEAEKLIGKYGSKKLVKKNAHWREQKPSDGQIRTLNRHRAYKEGMTKGDCADAITLKTTLNAIKGK